ncbi:ArsR/SmtB family transcription factor [Rubellimicrobium aerolatum]|uniref:ArsR/SmtB family transcription factor n=1 Tax=Rubellimicrobium aerolatum TaxID=490979 RepID=A0ABW0S5X7_9RHOB|nr:metalloregulator ArsR/SmtB family transcription factor [Rubellimicrobium aerolatum]MBP1804578.1 DNA-binding transcriptional ArsR family regulator [Rubellimicrobium aerolatum]
MTNNQGLDVVFQTLADPTRRAILARLARGPATVTDLAAPSGLALPTVLQHLRKLEEAGLIETTKQGRTRTCALRAGALAPARSWMEEQRLLWEGRHDRLDDYLASLTDTPKESPS